MNDSLPRNLGLDLVRATEDAAIKAGRWMGKGKADEADRIANQAILKSINRIDIDGTLVLTERVRGREPYLACGARVGNGKGPQVDMVCDPIDGRLQLAMGHPGALSVIAVAPAGKMWAPDPAIYMDKIIVNHEVAPSLVPECLDAPPAWTLALVARAKSKPVQDLTVFILDRPRHEHLIGDVRAAGARVILRPDGDIAGGLMACMADSQVDILMGVGGVLEGLIVACAVKSLGGGMLGRLAPQSDVESEQLRSTGFDVRQILTCSEIVGSDDVFFVATGITSGPLLSGVSYHGRRANSNSLILRGLTHTMRKMEAEHFIPAESSQSFVK